MPEIVTKNPNQPFPIKVQKEYKEAPADALKVNFSSAELPALELSPGEGQTLSNGEPLDVGKTAATIEKSNVVSAEAQAQLTSEVNDKTKTAEVAAEGEGESATKDDGIPKFLKPPSTEKVKDKPLLKDGEKKEVITPITPKDKAGDRFDYAGYSDSDVRVLKQMSTEAKEAYSKVLKENKELSKLKDSTYLQHPNAYTLSPGYQQLQVDVQRAEQEGDIWQVCLRDMKAGKSIKPLEGWDKNGKPIYGAELKPTDDLEEAVRANMLAARQEASVRQGKLQEYPNRFKQQVGNDHSIIEQERSKRFAWVANPALLDYSVSVPGVGDKSLKQIKQDFINLFPTYQHHNQGVIVAADLMIALAVQGAELAEFKAGKQTAETKLAEVSRAEPSSTVKPSSNGHKGKEINGVSEFSLSGFPES